jgi:hypothetical protein
MFLASSRELGASSFFVKDRSTHRIFALERISNFTLCSLLLSSKKRGVVVEERPFRTAKKIEKRTPSLRRRSARSVHASDTKCRKCRIIAAHPTTAARPYAGLIHPSGGAKASASFGPHVPGAYL